jgi:glycosyltransferase involved in cell wall biosynthesis
MRILFIHRNFPGQFLYLVNYLSQQADHEVVFITQRQENSFPKVRKVLYQASARQTYHAHHYLTEYQEWVLHGQGVARAALQLKNEGFKPDIIYAHSWGGELFIKEVFPDTPLLCYFEWYSNPYGSDLDFDPERPCSLDNLCEIRIKNSPKLVSLASCEHAITPTRWQLQQFPPLFHGKFSVIHDGVSTQFFHPDSGAKLVIPEIGLDLSGAKEIVTYATSGMEPYRGFPQFMQAAAIIQQRRPHCHIVVGGHDTAFYSQTLPDGKTYRQYFMETLSLDLSRLHFVGYLPYAKYARLLQASHIHVYLTYPYILSWSLIEALASGCVVIASNTAPVTEVIREGWNGLLVDFFSPEQIADRVDEVFSHPDRMREVRGNARRTAEERYDVQKTLAETLSLINKLVDKRFL